LSEAGLSPEDLRSGKTWGILRFFTGRDLERFSQFLASGFFNRQDQLVKFFRTIAVHHPGYASPDLDKKKLFKAFFPGKKYDDKKIRYLFTDLNRMLELYLSVTNFLNDEGKFSQSLLDEHRKRNNVQEFTRVFNRLGDAKGEGHDTNWYFNRFQSEYKYLVYAFSLRKRKEKSNIEQALENLDKFYLARKLELSCEAENARNLLDKDYQSFMLDKLVDSIHGHHYADTPVIKVYLHVLALLRDNKNEEHFNGLTKALVNYEHCFSQNDLRELYSYPLNFCVRMINMGKMEYLPRIFEIYKVVLHNGVLLPGGILSQWDYKNIVTTSLRLGEYDWAEKFINSYKVYVPVNQQKNAYTYNMANVYFQRKQFGKALKLLLNVEFTDPVYQLDTRAMQLKIYYETGDEDALVYHCSAFRKFIRRMRMLTRFQQANYRNLISYTLKLVKTNGHPEKIRRLETELENIANVADKQWLKRKMDEFF